MTALSWIVALRERLAAPPPLALATEGVRLAALVPLFVDAGELWLQLQAPTGEELLPGVATLPQAPIESGGEPWLAAERCAARLGLDPTTVLRLGILDSVSSPWGDVVIPCVAATPPPPLDDAEPAAGLPARGTPARRARIRLPLRAARTPNLLEERRVALRGVEAWVVLAHIGPVKLAGVEVEIAELLLERLYQG